MKLHPITWILLCVAGLQLAALSIDLTVTAQGFAAAWRERSGWQTDNSVLQALLGQSLGAVLHRLGGVVVNATLAVWVEFLSRMHHRLRVENAKV